MSIGRTVQATAKDRALTLGELREFIGELDHAGAAETTPIEARVTMRGGIKSMMATAVRFGDPSTE